MDDLYNEFADLAALEKVKQRILAIFAEIKAGVAGLNDIGIKIDGAQSVKEFGSAQQMYNAYIKDADRLKKTLLDTEKKLYESERQYAAIIASNRVELTKNNKELQAEAQYNNAVTGSREKAMAAIKKYGIEKNRLNLYNEEEKKQYDELVKKIERYENFLKKTGTALERQKINIGNYAGSLAAPFEMLQNKLNELQADLQKGIGIGGTDAAALSRSASAITSITVALDKSKATGVTAERQVRNLSNAYKDLSITIGKAGGQTETAFLKNLGEAVGEAKDDVSDLRDQLALNASDTKGIDNVVGSLNVLAGVAQGAAGAYALMGASQEDAARVTSKLIAVQGIAASIQQVGSELTRKGTIANRAYESVLKIVTTASNTTATATTRLAAATKLLFGAAIIGGIAFLIVKYVQMRNAMSDAARQAKILSDVNKEIAENAGSEMSKLDSLYKVATNNNLAIKDRRKAVDELQKQYPDYFKNIKDEIILQGKAGEAYAKTKLAILEVAKTRAIENKLSELATKELQINFDNQDRMERLQDARQQKRYNDMERRRNKDKGYGNTVSPEKFIAGDLAVEALTEQLNESNKELDQIGKDREFLLNQITKPDISPDGAAKAKAELKKITDNTAADILKSNYEIAKMKLERMAASDREIIDDETKTFDERLSALKTFTAAQMQLIDIEVQYQIAAEEMKRMEIMAGLEQERKDILKNKDLTKEQKLKGIRDINAQIERENLASTKRITVIEQKGFDNIIAAGKNFNKELKALKKGRDDIRREEEQQIQDYEQFTTDAINKARNAQLEGEKDYQKKRAAAIEKANNDIKAGLKNLYKEVLDTFLFFLTASIDKESAQLDTRKRLLDEDTQRRINNINMLGGAEEDRIKQIAAVEKDAAFQTEQIERKKRRLAVERARFEKMANIASIIANTAAAVVGALKPDGVTPLPLRIALAAIIGGIGVLQLARAAAAPLPQYAKGTDSAKPGKAIVGEEGQELVRRNGQYFLTPGRPTIMDMVGGEQITPAHLTKDIMNSVSFTHRNAINGMTTLKVNGMTSQQADKMIDQMRDLNDTTRKSRIIIHNEHGIESTPYYLKNIR